MKSSNRPSRSNLCIPAKSPSHTRRSSISPSKPTNDILIIKQQNTVLKDELIYWKNKYAEVQQSQEFQDFAFWKSKFERVSEENSIRKANDYLLFEYQKHIEELIQKIYQQEQIIKELLLKNQDYEKVFGKIRRSDSTLRICQQKLSEENEFFRQNLLILEEENDKLLGQMKQLNYEIEQVKKSHDDEISGNKLKCLDFENLISKQKNQINSDKKQYCELEVNLQDALSKQKEHLYQIEMLKRNQMDLEKSKLDQNNQIKELDKMMRDQLFEFENSLISYQQANSGLSKDRLQLQQEKGELEGMVNEYQVKISLMEEKALQDKNWMQSQVQTMQQNSMRKSEAILADLDHYKKESASQESLIVNLEKQIEKLNKQIRKLTSENLELDNGIQMWEQKYYELKRQMEVSVQFKEEQLQQMMSQMEMSYDERVQSEEAKMTTLQHLLETRNRENDNLKNSTLVLHDENNKQQKMLNDLMQSRLKESRQVDNLLKLGNDYSRDRDGLIDQLETEIENLQNQLAQKVEETGYLRKDYIY